MFDYPFGTTDVLTAQYFCDLIGVSTVEAASVKKSNSIEGDIGEYGQKSVSTLKRNLLNVDEILRIPATKMLVNLRGNNPLLLDKMIYKKHELSKKLKDDPITNYNPIWIKNKQEKVIEKKQENTTKEEPIKNSEKGWDDV